MSLDYGKEYRCAGDAYEDLQRPGAVFTFAPQDHVGGLLWYFVYIPEDDLMFVDFELVDQFQGWFVCKTSALGEHCMDLVNIAWSFTGYGWTEEECFKNVHDLEKSIGTKVFETLVQDFIQRIFGTGWTVAFKETIVGKPHGQGYEYISLVSASQWYPDRLFGFFRS
jgi:hypothetical protein